MSVTQGSTNFGISVHDTPQIGQWDQPHVRHSWFAVLGEATFKGRNHGREIRLTAHLTGYASLTLLLSGLNTIQNARGLTGALTINLGGGDAPTFANCVFQSCEVTEDPWLDGSGQNGWQCDITLTWRQSAV